MRHAVNLHTTLGIQHQQTNKQTTKEKGNFVLRVKRVLEFYDILDFSSSPVHNFPSGVFLFAQYVGHRAHWLSVGVRTAISFSIWSEVQAAVKESPITPPPNHDWRGRKSRGGLSSPLHRAQPPPQAVAINISGSPHYYRHCSTAAAAVHYSTNYQLAPPIAFK